MRRKKDATKKISDTKNRNKRKQSGEKNGESKIKDPLYSNVAYDSAFRTMESECDDILIPFVNFLFSESYRGDAVVSRLRNEQFTGFRNHSTQKRITDSRFRITQDSISKIYHLECESKPYDGSLLVRFFEYDAQIAKNDSDVDFAKLKVRIPNAGLLLLRGSANVPDKVCIEIETPEDSVSYHVAVIKESDFTIEKIFDKRLYLMIPFYIFNFEKDLAEINENEDRINSLVEKYKYIIARLDKEHEQGRLSTLSHGVIIRLTHSVMHKFLMKHKKVQKKVGDVMGGEVLDLPEIRIAHEAEARGLKKGEEERKKLKAENEALRREIDRLKGSERK